MHPNTKRAFTLVELLVVMGLIVILAGLILAVIPAVQKKQANTRATSEIKTIAAALETYKADNGAYPDDATYDSSGNYTKGYTSQLDARLANDPTSTSAPSNYASANLVLYRALSGDRDLSRKSPAANPADMNLDLDGQSLTTPLPGPPTPYYNFPNGMLLPANGVGSVTQIVDPFGYPYGYSTAYQGDILSAANVTPPTAPTHGFNPTYDLWSTGGQIAQTSDSPTQIGLKRAKWLYNWQSSGSGATGNAGQ